MSSAHRSSTCATLSSASPPLAAHMTAQRASTRIGQRGKTTWDLVALGDSTPTGHGVGADRSYVQVYAGYIEQDLGLTVLVHNWATDSARTVADWAKEVRSNKALRGDIRSAEVVTLWLGWHDLIPNIGTGEAGSCYMHPHEVDLDCLATVTDPMRHAFDDLLSEIVSLASPSESLIFIADVGIPSLLIARWREDGNLDLMKHHAYEVWRHYLIHSANKHNLRVVQTCQAFNGPGFDQEIPPEYMQPDGLHFNEHGHARIAAIHRASGYE